jgi:hypothetical protein
VTLLDVRASLSHHEQARLLSQSADSGWLNATPTQQVLQIANKHFSRAIVERVCALQTHVGFDLSFNGRCPCGDVFSSFHALSCFKDGNPERTDIHETIKRELALLLSAAQCRRIRLEPKASDVAGDRADIEVGDYGRNGEVLWIDVALVSTARVSEGLAAAHVPGVAAAAKEKEKRRHYNPLAAAHLPVSAIFIPFIIELDGRFGDAALDLLNELGRRVGDSIGEQNRWRVYWKRRISIVLRRAVSMALDSRFKKALVFSSSTSSSSFIPNPSSEAERAHIISVPPLGVSGLTFCSAGANNFV